MLKVLLISVLFLVIGYNYSHAQKNDAKDIYNYISANHNLETIELYLDSLMYEKENVNFYSKFTLFKITIILFG